ncbi:putative toxin-antitoxin system toxin component, PIN family [Mucilaginibacter yixingensis]|uniref:putative toxin-antitoxin system toxin component, PIN family n=1 Tax=Mucilaginibacter yixingensis TaxID=1295612 RepID=UPI000D3070F3
MPNLNKSLLLILDTNLWISFLIKNDISKIERILYSGNITLLFSNELIEEIASVTKRAKFSKFFKPKDVESFFHLISPYMKVIEVKSVITQCRDIKDNFLLALAIDGSADYLLTGDNDLLSVKTIGNTKIITITDFLSSL